MSYMWYLTLLFAMHMCGQAIWAAVSVNKIVMRPPKPNDIGLIFDLSVINTEIGGKKEMLEFRVRSDGTCCLNLTNGHMMKDAGRVVGGNFGFIEAGASETVSLIWPTISLYNRVGSCPIILTSINSNSEQFHIKQTVFFDTRFVTLDPDCHMMRKKKNFMDCNNWDKDYLKNCTPVDCEERYFGRRSYYNFTTEQCEEVPRCSEAYELYDFYANECIDTQHFCSEEDIQMIKQGKFEDNMLDLKSGAMPAPNVVVNDNEDAKTEMKRSDDSNNNIDSDGDNNKIDELVTREADEAESLGADSSTVPNWLKGMADGLLIVFATIAIYVLICFIIFLIVTWLSRRHYPSHCDRDCTVSMSEYAPIYTTSSLMSQR